MNRVIHKLLLTVMLIVLVSFGANLTFSYDDPQWNQEQSSRFLYSGAFYNFSLKDPAAAGNIESLLKGENTLAITARDKKTEEIIKDFTVDIFIIEVNKILLIDLLSPTDVQIIPDAVIGRMESVKSNEDGICIFDDVPEGRYKIVIRTDKYREFTTIIDIPGIGDTYTAELDPGAIVKGKLIDFKTRKGVSDITVVLRNMTDSNFSDVRVDSDEKGEFILKGLPSGEYKVSFEGFYKELRSLSDLFERNLKKTNQDNEMTIFKTDFIRPMLDKFQNSTYYLEPEIEDSINLKEYNVADLETIELHYLPIVDLQIVNDKGEMLPNIPFSIMGYKAKDEIQRLDLITDKEGKIKIVVPSSFISLPIVFCVPDLMEPQYKITIPAKLSPEKKDVIIYEERCRDHPEHPNAEICIPETDKRMKIKLVVKSIPDNMNYSLIVRDKETKEPVTEYNGTILSEEVSFRSEIFMNLMTNIDTWMIADMPDYVKFSCKDKSGRKVMSRYDKNIFYNRFNMSAGTENIPPDSKMKIAISASGYSTQFFSVPALKFLTSGEDIFELQKNYANVKGKVYFKPVNGPLTMDALLNAANEKGFEELAAQSRKFMADGKGKNILVINIQDNSRLTKDTIREDKSGEKPLTSNFLPSSFYLIDENGDFHLDNLTPGDQWRLRINGDPFFSTYVQNNIILKPGDNDLGIIYIDFPSKLSGIFIDENKHPIQNVLINYPLEGRVTGNSFVLRTDNTGAFSIRKNLHNSEQFIAFIPPWEFKIPEKFFIRDECTFSNIDIISAPINSFFFMEKTLDTENDETLNLTLNRGNTLLVNIEETSGCVSIAKNYHKRNPNIESKDSSSAPDNVRIVLSKVTIASASPDSQGVRFVKHFSPAPPDDELCTRSLQLAISNIPPGKYGITAECSILPLKNKNGKNLLQPEEINQADNNLNSSPISQFLLSYEEFDMPDTTKTISMKPHKGEMRATVNKSMLPDTQNHTYNLLIKKPAYYISLSGTRYYGFFPMDTQEEFPIESYRKPLYFQSKPVFQKYPANSDSREKNGSGKSEISFKNLPSGMYNVSITKSGNEKIFTKEMKIEEGKENSLSIP